MADFAERARRRHKQGNQLIAWRLLWIGPAWVTRVLFCATIFCGWGWDSAHRAWRDTW